MWNIFFRDAGDALYVAGFSEIAYADDLSGSRAYPTHLSENFLLEVPFTNALLLATGNCSLFYGRHGFILMQKY